MPRSRLLFRILLLSLPCLSLPSPVSAQQNRDGFDMTPQQFWAGPWGVAPRMPMAADLDGDGHADLVSLWPNGEGVIDAVFTSPLGKPRDSIAFRGFGRDGIAVAAGEFDGLTGADVVGVFANGEVRVASGFVAKKSQFERNLLVATLPKAMVPQAPIQTVVADFDGDGQADVLLVGADRQAVLLRGTRQGNDARFRPLRLAAAFPEYKQLTAGPVAGTDSRARLFWLGSDGVLYRSVLKLGGGDALVSLAAPVKALSGISPDAKLAAGHFRGDPGAVDVIVGQMFLPGGDPAKARQMASLPTVEQARDDRAWIVADFDGDGKDDLLRTRRSGARDLNEDAFIHFSYDPRNEPGKGYFSATNDGLPDCWKLGLIHPGGLDLSAMGCKVGHHDLIVEVQPLADVPMDRLKQQMDRAARYYASLPVTNLDGTTGIYLHILYREPIPTTLRDSKHWADWSDMWRILWPQYVLPAHRGITHYVGIQNGSAGYGGGDRSWCGNGWHEFVHEMGHQLWLNHSGHWPQEFSAVYPSLMNYAYSYSLEDDGEKTGYSTGALSVLGALNEEHLNEVLPVPMAKVKFLAGGPFHFHLQPGSDPNTTLVDWNWNGVFGEKDVRADLNYSHGVRIDPRFDVGHSWSAPGMVVQRGSDGAEHLLLFMGKFPAGTPVPPPTADAPTPSISGSAPGGITVRVWQGHDRDSEGQRWSDEVPVTTAGVQGDFSAASVTGDATWVAYPGGSGIALKRITVGGDGALQVGSDTVDIPEKTGAIPTLTAVGDRYVLLLWHGSSVPLAYRILTPNGKGSISVGEERTLPFNSFVPVAAVAGAAGPTGPCLWIARMEPGEGANRFHTEVRRLVSAGTKTEQWTPGEQRWVDGQYKPFRPTLLWEPGLGEQGRLYLLSGGMGHRENPWSEQYITMQTAYPEGHGWQYRKYYTDDYASRCAPAACWFQGNMAYALRLYSSDTSRNDVVSFSFRGTGATPQPQGDYDDVGIISGMALSRSIRTIQDNH